MKRFWLGLVSGALFGAGLSISQMTSPARVVGFLDFFGSWDASLLWVMVGAIAIHLPAHRLIVRLKRPLACPTFQIPAQQGIDAKLLLGASIFGLGWGLGGFCPGPAIASAFTGLRGAVGFIFMILGVWAFERLEVAKARHSTVSSVPEKRAPAVCA